MCSPGTDEGETAISWSQQIADCRKLPIDTSLLHRKWKHFSYMYQKYHEKFWLGSMLLLEKYVDQYFQDTNVTCNHFPSENYRPAPPPCI